MSDAAAIDLLVLDDHALVREGVMLLLQQRPWIARCRGAACIDDALRLMEAAPADAAVIDLSLKHESGLNAIELLLGRWPGLPIVVLTMYADAMHCQRALHRGALGFVAKDDASDELALALERALAGHGHVSAAVRRDHVGDAGRGGAPTALAFEDAMALLTPRERQVLALIGQGRSAAEVASQLGRSVKTVEAHRNNLREKLGLKNNRQLLQLSARWTQLEALGSGI